MPRNKGDDVQHTMIFESVGIGPAGGEPTEFVPVDVDYNPSAAPKRRKWGVAFGIGLVVVFATFVWITTRPPSPNAFENWLPALPRDPTEAFVWNVPDADEDRLFVAGSADQPYMMTLTSASSTIYALDGTGRERWRAPIGNGTWADAFPDGDAIVATVLNNDRLAEGSEGLTVTGLNSDDGAQLWQTTVPGDYWLRLDGYLVSVKSADELVLDSNEGPQRPPTDLYSIDISTGQRGPQRRYDAVYVDFAGGTPLVEADGQLFTIDGSLSPSSTPVPAGSRGAAFDGETIITFDDEAVTVYDTNGTKLRSTRVLPEPLSDSTPWSIVGVGSDRWLYTSGDDDLECGVVRFSDGDDALVELWSEEMCYAYTYFWFALPDAAADIRSRYAFVHNVFETTTQVVDVETGSTIAEGESPTLGTNGVAIFDGKHIIGQSFRTDGRTEPLFDLPAAPNRWTLFGGAIAIFEKDGNGNSVSVTVYR